VTTTLDLPDQLLREAQAEASDRGLSLQDFLAGVLQAKLAPKQEQPGHPAAWRDFYGSLRHLHGERQKIESLIEEEFEHA
jgi:hypothetical protein